jgi:signal transduction histidine kinase
MRMAASSCDHDAEVERSIDGAGDRAPSFAEVAPLLAHEAMNIVMGLQGASMLLAEVGPDGVADRMEQLAERVERLGRHLGQYARADELALRWIDPFVIVAEAVAAVATERGAVVDIGCGHGSQRALGDEESLRLALTYLIRHLVLRTPAQTSVQVSIFATSDEHAGHVVFQIGATGCPAHLSDARRVFEPFHARLGGESGLELAIARRIARAHGGETTARRVGDRQILTLAIPAGRGR